MSPTLVTGSAALIFVTGFSATASTQEVIHLNTGESTDDQFGYSVSGAGDVNNDGFDDYIVGIPRLAAGPGGAVVFSGADGLELWTFVGSDPPGDLFGSAVSGVGDTDGDGYEDVVVSAIHDDTNGRLSGSVFLYSGKDGSLRHRWIGQANDILGGSLAAAGDVDGDGCADVFIGAKQAPGPGYAELRSGLDGSLLFHLVAPPGFDSSRFGVAVAGAGDVNMDGIPDLLVGDECATNAGASSAGSAWVFSGADGSVLHGFHHDQSNSEFGKAVSGAGDVDGDGHDDVIVGAWRDDTAGDDSGIVFVYSGKDWSVLYQFLRPGYSEREVLGFSVAGGEDFDGDGTPDFFLGAPGNDFALKDAGAVWVFSGRDGDLLYWFDGKGENGDMGFSVSVAGDMNGDGFPELITGAPYQDTANGTRTGAVTVYSGNDLFLNAVPKNPDPRQFVRLTTGSGPPGNPVATFVLEFDGAPFILPIAIGFFDAAGEFEQLERVPAGLSGHTATFHTFAISATGKIIETGMEKICFQ